MTSHHSMPTMQKKTSEGFLLEYRTGADAASIRASAVSLRAFLDNMALVSSVAHLVELAVTEGMNNVLEHSYENTANLGLRLLISFEKELLTVSIFDRGEEPDIERVSSIPPEDGASPAIASLSDLRSEGRGCYIMHSLMDSVEYERVGDENCLRLILLVH